MKRFGLLPKLITALIFGIFIGNLCPKWIIELLSTYNTVFGNFLGFSIPLIIIAFVAPGIGELGNEAGKSLGITVFIAYFSTVLSGCIAFFSNSILLPKLLIYGSLTLNSNNPKHALIQPLFNISIPPLMEVISALIIAFILGIGIATTKSSSIKNFMNDFQIIIEKLISKVIIPLLPYHILGIFANMTYAGQVATIISVFAKVFIIIITLHILVIIFQYSIGAFLYGINPLKLIKNMIPAYIMALGTQSSAATIPVTLKGSKKNGVDDGVAEFVIPLCATIHLSGSTITIVSCAMSVMISNNMVPTFHNIFPFILMLGITMVAAPGVPGGAVMAALGLLESMLNFSPTLTSLMIALYLAQDSFGTAANVTGDGAIALLVNKFSRKPLTLHK